MKKLVFFIAICFLTNFAIAANDEWPVFSNEKDAEQTLYMFTGITNKFPKTTKIGDYYYKINPQTCEISFNPDNIINDGKIVEYKIAESLDTDETATSKIYALFVDAELIDNSQITVTRSDEDGENEDGDRTSIIVNDGSPIIEENDQEIKKERKPRKKKKKDSSVSKKDDDIQISKVHRRKSNSPAKSYKPIVVPSSEPVIPTHEEKKTTSIFESSPDVSSTNPESMEQPHVKVDTIKKKKKPKSDKKDCAIM